MATRLKDSIRRGGPLPFPEFMAAALYDPQAGYYAAASDQVGRGGDFFTSVSAGPLFGRLLAARILDWWRESGCPPAWRIVEPGAHDGSLAHDILSAIEATRAEAFEGLEYLILEPLARLAGAQRRKLAGFGGRVVVAAAPGNIPRKPGFLIANEVLDALPCHIVEATAGGWSEIGVGLDQAGGFTWTPLGPAGELAKTLPPRAPGYRSEIRPHLREFLAPLVPLTSPGRMLWIDYGFERGDYYAESRTNGTLRTFRRHQAGENPLDAPGSRDITAHVDFTALGEAVEALGGRVACFENQSRFLTRIGTPWLRTLEGNTGPATAKLLRNFQTLTHPAQLGARFHLVEAAWD